MISHEHEFIYMRIPKAANTHIISFLANLVSSERFIFNAFDFDRYHLTKRYFKGAGGASVWKGASLNQYKALSFARNPYDRTLSCFLSVFKKEAYRKKYRFTDLSSDFSSGDYLRFLSFLDRGGLYKNHHWIPQADFMWRGVESLGFLGHVENLQKDLVELADWLGFDKGIARDLISSGHGPSNRNAYSEDDSDREQRWQKYYGDHADGEKARSLVKKLYQRDFENFGYRP
jgi:hypothetical protein